MIPGMTICSAVQLRQSQSEEIWSDFRDCSTVTGADLSLTRQESGESTWEPVNDSEWATNSANGSISSLIVWTGLQPPGNVATVSVYCSLPDRQAREGRSVPPYLTCIRRRGGILGDSASAPCRQGHNIDVGQK